MSDIIFKDLGKIGYEEAFVYQEQLLKRGLEVKAARFNKDQTLVTKENIRNYLLFCEHPHVYTLGKSGHIENLLISDVRLKELDVTFHKTNRGGDITYHGPGQIVAYPILDLEQFFTDLGKYMRCLEETVILTLNDYGIKAGRSSGETGVWLDADDKEKARKICAMGVKCSRWMTMHGLALNVNTDMSFFDHIVPCGITDKSVTSIEKELGKEVDIEDVKARLKDNFGRVFEAEIIMQPEAATI